MVTLVRWGSVAKMTAEQCRDKAHDLFAQADEAYRSGLLHTAGYLEECGATWIDRAEMKERGEQP